MPRLPCVQAQPIRLLLAYAGVEYEDRRYGVTVTPDGCGAALRSPPRERARMPACLRAHGAACLRARGACARTAPCARDRRGGDSHTWLPATDAWDAATT